MGIDDSADNPIPQPTDYLGKVKETLENLKTRAIQGDETLGPDQIIPHFLHSRLTSALSFLELEKIDQEEAREAIRLTYEAIKEVHEKNEDFRKTVPDLKVEFANNYHTGGRRNEPDDYGGVGRTEELIGPLSEFIDDFREESSGEQS